MIRQASRWKSASHHAEAEDLTVFLMQFLDLESVLAISDDIVVALVPPGNSCQLWTRISGKRVQKQAMEHQTTQECYHECAGTLPGKRIHSDYDGRVSPFNEVVSVSRYAVSERKHHCD